MSNAIIIGRRRQGKSTLAYAFAATKSNTIVIWDPNGQYMNPGIEQQSPETIQTWLESLDPDEINTCRVGPYDGDDIPTQFAALTDKLWNYDGYALIVDEAPMLQTPQRIEPNLARLLRRSPAETWVIQTGHRLYEMHTLSRVLVDDIIMFPCESERERDYLDANYSKGFGELTRRIHGREYAHWYRREAGLTQFTVRRRSDVWNIDLNNRNQQLRDSNEAASLRVEQKTEGRGSAAGGVDLAENVITDGAGADGAGAGADGAGAGADGAGAEAGAGTTVVF